MAQEIIGSEEPENREEAPVAKDLKSMNLAELTAEYNKLAPKAVKKLSDKKSALAKIAALQKAKGAKGNGTRKAGGTIKVLATENPRRAGTDAHMHFAAMKNGITVEKYLDGFEDRRKARQWLSNTVRDGHVQITA
jgi:hypothetical protein